MLATCSLLVPLTAFSLAAGPPPGPLPPKPEQVRAAVIRSLPLLQKGAAGYADERTCFSCHNQALPLLALTTARARGFAVNEKERRRQVRFTVDSLERNRANYHKGTGQGGQADTAGYALLALDVGGWKADATTSAVVEYLILRDRDAGYWRAVSRRPPSEASAFTTTYLAVRGLRTFGRPEQQKRIAARLEAAVRWLRASRARDTEDRVFRLGALKFAGAAGEDVRAAAQELARTQRGDGGWAQTTELASDAYATGSALVVLHQLGGMATSDPAYQRGLRFLIDTQQADGSWKVRSRSRPFQTYFETGFPHGKDQFISIAASGWATTALALACLADATRKPEVLALPRQE
jgi:hypothetical protein